MVNSVFSLRKYSRIVLVVLVASSSAVAQPLPNAGGQILQIPPPPVLQDATPDLRIERNEPQSAPTPSGEKFRVNSLRVTGATRFSEAELEAELIAITDFQPGSELDLAELRTIAAKITDYYNRQGYFVAQAFLPAQTVTDGGVTIEVIEGRYDKVTLNNQTNLSNRLA